MEVAIYSVLVGVFLLSLYAVPLLVKARPSVKGLINFLGWIPFDGYKSSKAQLIHDDELTLKYSKEAEIETNVQKESPYSTDWWTSSKIFELENRAIFGKSWLYATHTSRFKKPGDYHTLTIGPFFIFLILGTDHTIRAFHNVCRHRAYTVTRKSCGSSRVLGCRYHGWSYDTMGRLVKAPEFDNVKGFEKERNGLFEVKTTVSRSGFVMVNHDGSSLNVVEPKFEDVELAARGQKIEKSKWVAEWRFEGQFNWKLAASNKNSENEASQRNTIFPQVLFGWVLSRFKQENNEVSVFPTTRICWYPSASSWVTIRILPDSATRTIFQCDLFKIGDAQLKRIDVFKTKLMEVIKDEVERLERQQKQLLGGSSKLDNTIVQDAINDRLREHLQLERLQGREIYPAARGQSFSAEGKEDDDLCRELESAQSKELRGSDSDNSSQLKNSLEW